MCLKVDIVNKIRNSITKECAETHMVICHVCHDDNIDHANLRHQLIQKDMDIEESFTSTTPSKPLPAVLQYLLTLFTKAASATDIISTVYMYTNININTPIPAAKNKGQSCSPLWPTTAISIPLPIFISQRLILKPS